MQASLYLQDVGWPVIRLFIRFLTADQEEVPLATALYGTAEVNVAIIDIVKSTSGIRRFVEVCELKVQELQDVDARLVSIIQSAKETRLNLLRILGTPRSRSPYD